MPRDLNRLLSLDDFERAAARHLPRPVFGYVAGAAEDNASVRDNRAAFAEFGFVPRSVVDVSKRTTATTLFAHVYAQPFGIAPLGLSALSAYRADLVFAHAARAAGIPMIMSGSSLIRLEEVAAVHPDAWFQAYLPGESERIAALVDRVAAAGFRTLVLTVDAQVLANRENNVRAGFTIPLRPSVRLAWDGLTHPRWLFGTALRTLVKHGMPHFENAYRERGAPILSRHVERDFGTRDHLTWAHVEAVRRRFTGRLVLKGIVSPDDARIARELGADGLIVSNHGGRQLDGTVAPLRMLPAIVAAAPGMAIMLDSGIRRGTDVLKALALGAQFVFVGRPFVYGAALAGRAGVDRVIELLGAEVHRDLGMLGLTSPAAMTSDRLVRLQQPAVPVHAPARLRGLA